MAIDYIVLKTELNIDPQGYGYSAYWANGQDWKLAELINQTRDNILIARDIVPAYEIFETIVPSEWVSLSAQEKERIQLILSMGEILIKGENTKASFQTAFGAGTTTRKNILNLITRKGSRAEQLFGSGILISWDDVAKARGA